MSQDLILAIDQGTTGSTVLIVDAANKMRVLGRATVNFPQYYPKIGWVEHDLEEIWDSVAQATIKAIEVTKREMTSFRPNLIKAIGITNQRETLCVFDRKTSRPLTRAIVWQCKRSTDICDRLKKEGLEATFREKTGLLLDPYFSGTKLTWLIENQPEVASALANGRAIVGTIDSYLIHRLSGGQTHATEPSNASRTLLYNIAKGGWDEELCSLLKLDNADCLPRLNDSVGDFGKTLGLSFLPDGLPICGALGDQQAALAGQTCFLPGEAKCTYGTGAFLLANTGEELIASRFGLLTTVAWSLKGKLTYCFEGSSFICGAAVQFIRDQLELLEDAAQSGPMAQDAAAAPEVYFVPSLAGLGAPHWDPKARGAVFGLTRGTTKHQVIRAALEGIAFQVADLVGCMQEDLGGTLPVLRVDGGAAGNDLLMGIQAQIAAIDVDRPANLESTALGAAMFAALGCGMFSSLDELKDNRVRDRLFRPDHSEAARSVVKLQRDGWNRAVQAVRTFSGNIP